MFVITAIRPNLQSISLYLPSYSLTWMRNIIGSIYVGVLGAIVDMVPDNDHTSLVLEVFCTAGDEIAQRCIDDLVDKLNFVKREEVENWTVIRT